MPITQTNLNQVFDGDGNLLEEAAVEVDVTVDAVRYDIHTKLRQWLIDPSLEPAALRRVLSDLVRLVVANDMPGGAEKDTLTAA